MSWPRKFSNKSDSNRPPESSIFCEIGFHGDSYLLDVVKRCLRGSEQFIETGANVGSTLAYVAMECPNLKIYSCEPDFKAFETARANVSEYPHVTLFNLPSPAVFQALFKNDSRATTRDTVFWLDAHCYGFQWPLRDEIALITKYFERGHIFIDDFKVPGMDCFKYFIDGGQECSFEYIQGSLHPSRQYCVYYPNYRERTSTHHPLCGWGLIEFGLHKPLELPAVLKEKIRGPIEVSV
jgi:hypothetical protein